MWPLWCRCERASYKEGDHYKFTVSKDGRYTYVIADELTGSTATIKDISPKSGSNIYMLGVKKQWAWTQLSNGDYLITLPKKLPGSTAWIFKVVN